MILTYLPSYERARCLLNSLEYFVEIAAHVERKLKMVYTD